MQNSDNFSLGEAAPLVAGENQEGAEVDMVDMVDEVDEVSVAVVGPLGVGRVAKLERQH